MATRLLLLAALLLLASPAGAVSVFTLPLDPSQSFLEILEGPGNVVVGPVALSGSITIELDDAPGNGFVITALQATGTDTDLALWEFAADPAGLYGSGVLFFTNVLTLDGVIPQIPPLTGSQAFNWGTNPGFGTYTTDGDGAVTGVAIPWTVDVGALTQVHVQLVAIPEPATALLVALGLGTLTALRRR